jgi:hypothetical protein
MRWVFAVTAGALLVPRMAHAQSEPWLSVTREESAESCPDTEALLAHVERVRGHAATGESSAYHVSFSYRGGAFRASIKSGASGAARVLHDRGATCASLEEATAVTLALLLDSDAREPEPKPEPAPEPAKPPKTEPPRFEEPASSTAVSLSLSVGGGGLVGVVQPVTPVALAELGIGIDRFRTNLGVLWMPSQAFNFGPGSIDESLIAGMARTCLSAWRGESVRFDLCSGIYAGLLRVQAHNYTRNDATQKSWLAVPLGFAFASASAPVGAELGVSALLPLRRNDVSIDGVGVAYESWPVGMLLSVRAVGSWLL